MALGEHDDLWDLRRGDVEDNRSSPKWHGWRALAITTALEFNYLSAAITFVWLIVVPAIVVGLIVPGVVVLVRSKVAAAELITISPASAVIALALLVGAVFLVGRALLAASLDNFWHLHHTLVFPLFVTLREVISIGLEALPSRALDDYALHRLRRASTVLATVLLAGSGVALAFAVPFSTAAGLEDLRHVSPAAVTGAALGNALVVLGLSTTIASVYWFAREISSTPPVLNWTPSQPMPEAHTLRIAHLSDLHIVGERYGYRMEPGTSGPCGNDRTTRAFCQLETIRATQALDRIIVTGDITDAGTRAEWLEFLALVQAWPDLRRRLLFVPGNHDVNVIDRTNPGRLDLPWSVAGALRKLRVVLALDAVQGESVHLVTRGSGALGCTLREYLRSGNRSTLLRDLAERGTWRGRWELSQVWEAIYPLVLPPSEEGCGVILLDSNARRYFSLTNAIGFINREQLLALRAVLRSAPAAAAWIIAVHHHLVEYPIRGLGLQERAGVVLVNASDVLRVIARCDRPVVILHGHRHRDWIGTRDSVVVCSAPSVTLGDKGSQRCDGQFSIYDIALAPDGRVQVPSVNRVRVA